MLPTAHSAAVCCLTANRAIRGRFDQVRQWLADGLDVEPETAWDSLREWSRGAGLGNLRELGVPHEALESSALAASSSSSMKANPVQLDSEQLLEMLEAAWEGGQVLSGIIRFCCKSIAPNFRFQLVEI